MIAAAVCTESKPGDTAGNLEKIRAAALRAAAEGAVVVLCPELSLTGFLPNHPVGDHNAWLREALRCAREMAEPLTGAAVAGLVAVAKETGVMVSAGMLEDAGNVLHNTQVLAGADGLLGWWRKMHVPMFEMPFYNGGGVPLVASTAAGAIGVNICFDALLPESTRLLAVQNVETVLFPFAADPACGWAEWAGGALRARCAENGVFGLACNYLGEVECAGVRQVFPGGAMAVGPRGEVLAASDGDMVVAEFRREDLLAARAEPEYLFRFRRPELYGLLTK